MDRLDGLNPALVVRAEEREICEMSSDLIILIFIHLSLADWRQNSLQLVSRQWRLCAFSKPVLESLVSPFLMGSDKWWKGVSLLPKSINPSSTELMMNPCPFTPGKLFIETHLITYIGKEFEVSLKKGGSQHFLCLSIQ